MGAERAEQRRQGASGRVDPHAQHQRARREDRFVQGVEDHQGADALGVVDVSGDEFQEGGAQVVEDPPEAGTRSLTHARSIGAAIRNRSTPYRS
ncbi:hypothetical protein HerbRD11066_21660 [Herbidospora sp. RD11066]